jgi:flagellar biosynthetic protein FliQ
MTRAGAFSGKAESGFPSENAKAQKRKSAKAQGQGNDLMTGPEVLDVARDSLVTLVLVASPLMLIGLVVGVAISLLQALTQIQEMTLVFVPKILAIFAAMLIALPFMADLLQGHMLRIAARIMAE